MGTVYMGDAERVRMSRRVYRDALRQQYDQTHRRQRREAKLAWRHVRKNVLRVSKARAAMICGVSRGTVDRWESLEHWSLPDLAHLGILCEVCGYEAMSHMYRLCGIRSVLER